MKLYHIYIIIGGSLSKFIIEANGFYKDGESFIFFIEEIEGIKKPISVFPVCRTIIDKIKTL